MIKELPITETRLQEIANEAAWFLRLQCAPTVSLREVQRGKAYGRKNLVTIPKWSVSRGWPFVTYYVLHEVAHLHPESFGHGRTFKQHEVALLREWGLTIKRRRVYPRSLHSLNGATLYQHK
jgi:predicted SprT family Zn-dependent metalloprotease